MRLKYIILLAVAVVLLFAVRGRDLRVFWYDFVDSLSDEQYETVDVDIDGYAEEEFDDFDEPEPEPEPEVEPAPYMNFQGVLREGRVLYAIIGGEVYRRHDFIRDYRLVEVTPGYIIIQGRTRRFRYNLN